MRVGGQGRRVRRPVRAANLVRCDSRSDARAVAVVAIACPGVERGGRWEQAWLGLVPKRVAV